ncbi:ComEC/Rec2 family competence protein [Dawidia soli]|uniref:ComEC/Rec2 family competence protein n=1 Tax=Dawidia soli TaxID=2782352 RepID=A0AAP2D5M3_9BACT|nr:ComEC/Rec2 family competence protein [Dawidia soli]MBT1685562.1 ComEC/Rec2 family competence protein [Dawidia soli]
MYRWIPYAFVRMVVFLSVGILLAIHVPDCITTGLALATLVGVVFAYLLFLYWPGASFRPTWQGVLAMLALFLTGYLQVGYKTESRRDDHVWQAGDSVQYYQCRVVRQPVPRERAWKVTVEVDRAYTGVWRPRTGKVLLYLRPDVLPATPTYGDVLLVKGTPAAVPPPANPGEFDYRRYLQFQNIHLQQFLQKGQVMYMGHAPPSWVWAYALRVRGWAAGILATYIDGREEQAVASALVLGMTDDLDRDLLDAYSATGVVHVLAVSGLHVSILFLILGWALKPVQAFRYGRVVLAAVSLIVLWGYAFVTGLSPSVLRAVTMFSFVVVGQAFYRQGNVYNMLAASAFFLLLYNPYLIMSVGFQLSYLAVLGIVYLQPWLYNLWEPSSRVWDELWKMTCVTLAAQLATTAVVLFYFHQFPNYFLLVNLLLVPGSSIVLVGGLVLLACSAVPGVAGVLGYILTGCIHVLNGIVTTVAAFPFSVWNNVYLTPLQCWLLLAMGIFGAVWLQHRHYGYGVAMLCLAMLFSASRWHYIFREVRPARMTVYKVPGHSAWDLAADGRVRLYADAALDERKRRFHIQPNHQRCGATGEVVADVVERNDAVPGARLLVWRKKTILQIKGPEFRMPGHLSVDYLIISNNAIKDIKLLAAHIDAGQILLDSSNTYYFAARLLQDAVPLGLRVHSVWHRGAFQEITG